MKVIKYIFLFACLSCKGQSLVSIQPDFHYGVSTQEQRVSNWTLFKNLCDYHKKINGTISFASGKIELYHADKEKISMIDGERLNIIISGELIFYPFVPRPGYNYVFDMAYGGSLSITGGKIKMAQRMNLFESYRCEFLPNGIIRVLGAIRSDFWTGLRQGQVIYCSWNQKVLGKASKVAGWDKALKTVTLTDDLGVINVVAGQTWIGFDYVEGVSEYSYKTYGQHWVKWEYIDTRAFILINHSPPTSTGPDAVINLTSTKLENWGCPLFISSGAFKVNLKNTVEINNSEEGIAAFARSQLNHQSILGLKATLVMRNNGMNSVGSIDVISSANILGSGAYIHPTVIVQLDKFRGYNNPASTFRQYSTSIEVVCPPDYKSWINDFQCEGSGEEDLKTSNCMPVEVGYFKGNTLLTIGGSLNLKAGIIGRINLTRLLHPRDNVETNIQINNATITGPTTIGWEKGAAEFTDITFNKCKFVANLAFTSNPDQAHAVEEMIKNDGTAMRSITIKDSEYVRPEDVQIYTLGQPVPAGLSASALLRCIRFLNVNIDGMKTDFMKGVFLQHHSDQLQPPYNKVIIHIDHSQINMSGLIDSKNSVPGQIQGVDTSVPCLSLTGNWSKP